MTRPVGGGPSVGEALLLCLFAFFGLMFVAGVAGGGLLATGVGEVVFIGLPSAFAASRRGGAAAVGLVRPRPLDVLAGALVGVSAWAVIVILVLPLQERVAPTPPALEEALRRAVAPEPLALVSVAILPAICEELLLRGVLCGALVRKLGRVAGVVLSAAIFALLHGSLHRLLPTFLLGCAFGTLAVASGTIWPAIVAHALNNGALWLLAAFPTLEAGLDGNAPVAAAVGVVALTLGNVLVFSRFSAVK